MRNLLLASVCVALSGCVSTDYIFSGNSQNTDHSAQTKKRGATRHEHFTFMAGELDDEQAEDTEVRIIEGSAAPQDTKQNPPKRIIKVIKSASSVNDDNLMLMDTDSYAMPFVESETVEDGTEKTEVKVLKNNEATNENVQVWVTKGNVAEENIEVEIERSDSGQVLEKKVVVVTTDGTVSKEVSTASKVSTEMSDIIIKLIQTADLTDAEKARVKAALDK